MGSTQQNYNRGGNLNHSTPFLLIQPPQRTRSAKLFLLYPYAPIFAFLFSPKPDGQAEAEWVFETLSSLVSLPDRIRNLVPGPSLLSHWLETPQKGVNLVLTNPIAPPEQSQKMYQRI